ncbi:MAG: hypothetical protein QM796_22625 [Chthoniobacteraceae bacterium]
MTVEEGVEGVEELLLRAFLAGEELDVVDHQHVRLPVTLAELDQGAVLNGVDELVGELLAGEVHHLGRLLMTVHILADRLDEVRLAQTHTAIHEERIVGLGRGLRDRERGGMGELVVRAHHEGLEGIARVHPVGGNRGLRLGRDDRLRGGRTFHQRHQFRLRLFGHDGLFECRGGSCRRCRGAFTAFKLKLDLARAAEHREDGGVDERVVVGLDPQLEDLVGHLESEHLLVSAHQFNAAKPALKGVGTHLTTNDIGDMIPN